MKPALAGSDMNTCDLVIEAVTEDLDIKARVLARVMPHLPAGAVIATNTSVTRDGVQGLPHAEEAGGLSGRPIRNRATTVLKLLKAQLPDVTVIGAGGILSGGDAAEKFAAGASLVQLYTGLIYRGPELVGECVSAYRAK